MRFFRFLKFFALLILWSPLALWRWAREPMLKQADANAARAASLLSRIDEAERQLDEEAAEAPPLAYADVADVIKRTADKRVRGVDIDWDDVRKWLDGNEFLWIRTLNVDQCAAVAAANAIGIGDHLARKYTIPDVPWPRDISQPRPITAADVQLVNRRRPDGLSRLRSDVG